MRHITLYGAGCARCRQADATIRRVIAYLGCPIAYTHVSDMLSIARAGITATPAVTVDGVVVISGRVPSDIDVEEWCAES